MDLPSQMPLSRYSRTTICPFASSVLGILRLHSHVGCKYSCTASAAPLQLVTSSSSLCWRHAWSDKRTLNAFERCLNDGGAFSAKVDSGLRLKILSRHASRFQTNRSKVEHQKSISGLETGGLVESGKSANPLKLTRSSRAPESSGKGIKRSKREAQFADEPSGINFGNKSTKTQSRVSGTVNVTTLKKNLSSREGSSSVTVGTLGSSRSSQTSSLVVKINEDEVRMEMESVSMLSEQYSTKPPKRSKKNTEEVETYVKLNMCSKYADLHGALETYDKVKTEGVFQLKQHSYNVLLYICSGAASGSLVRGKSGRDDKKSETPTLHKSNQIIKGIEKSEPVTDMHLKHSSDAISIDPVDDTNEASRPDEVRFGLEDMDLAARRGLEIYQDMLNADVPCNEATYTAIARLAVAKGDGDLAFGMVKRMAAENIAPKLRSYGPPLLSFCEKNEVQKAFEVDDHMLAAGVLPDEGSLEALLRVSFEAGLADKVYSLLQRLRRTVREFSSTTVGTVERWFNSESAASAGKAEGAYLPSKEELKVAMEAGGGGWHGLGWLGKGKWNVRRTNLSKTGSCLSCGEQLCTIDIDPRETENFAKSVAELACQREQKVNDFKAFQEWLDCHGPFDAVIDGANIGLYNPQFSQGFNFYQLMSVVKAVRRTSTDKPPLVIVHCRHTNDRAALSKNVQEVLKRWIQAKAIYLTPRGSNDDWYWLYAAVKSKCLLVTNDEMRDHLFELLGNDFFPKWKERHQVRFTFETNDLELHMPPPYSIVMQESLNGLWHIPQIGGDDINIPREWLCVTRPDPVTSIPESVDDISCQQKGLTESHILHPEELGAVSKAGLMSSKLLNVDAKNPSEEVHSLSSSGRGAYVFSPASRSPSHASHPKRTRTQTPSHLSPTPSKTILKLEEAEELAESAVDFQI